MESEAPQIVKHLSWLRANWKQHWKLLVVAAIFLGAMPGYKAFTAIYQEYSEFRSQPKELGTFEITFVNRTAEILKVSRVAEFYVTEPESPGMNRRVSSGLIGVTEPNGYGFEVGPNSSIKVKAEIAAEQKYRQLLADGNTFVLVVFSASPKPVRTEVVFSRVRFLEGLEIAFNG